MTCNCVFCLFQQDGECHKRLSRIKIDERGMCSGFICIQLDGETLSKVKDPPLDPSKIGHIDLDDFFSD